MHRWSALLCLLVLAGAPQAWAATPTPIVPAVLVHVNHNRFNPLVGETVEVRGLTALHQKVNIRVFSQTGVLIKELLKDQEPGGQVPAWDGRNAGNEVVGNGVYVIVVTGYKLEKRFRVAVIK